MTTDFAAFIGTTVTLLLAVVAFFLKELHSEVKSNTKTLNQISGAQAVQDEKLRNHEVRLNKLEA